MFKLLLLATTLTALTPEERAAIAAAEINQQYAAASHAAAINKKVWILSVPKAQTVKEKAKVFEQIVTSYRQPTTHTHTCANKHSWDHKENSGHVCTALVMRNGKIEQCGLVSTVQDSPRKMVTMTRKIRSLEENVASAKVEVPSLIRQIETTPVNYVQQYIMPSHTASSLACANGQCSTITRWR